MVQGAYKIPKEEKFEPPQDWYISHKYFPRNLWDVGIVIYQRIISIDESDDMCEKKETYPGDTGKSVTFIRVEQVLAFRGTEPMSTWNWLTNLGLAYKQVPPQALIGMKFVKGAKYQAFATQKLIEDLEEESNNILKWPLHLREISERKMPHKDKLERLLKENRSLRIKVMKTTYTGHSLGASMAITRAAAEASLDNTQIIRAVVFDSPGSSALLTRSLKVWANSKGVTDEKNVVSYLTAPNIVNTLHPHAGQLVRLYVPHLTGSYGKYLRSNTPLSICEGVVRFFVLFFAL